MPIMRHFFAIVVSFLLAVGILRNAPDVFRGTFLDENPKVGKRD
jgi:hypothetical protein